MNDDDKDFQFFFQHQFDATYDHHYNRLFEYLRTKIISTENLNPIFDFLQQCKQLVEHESKSFNIWTTNKLSALPVYSSSFEICSCSLSRINDFFVCIISESDGQVKLFKLITPFHHQGFGAIFKAQYQTIDIGRTVDMVVQNIDLLHRFNKGIFYFWIVGEIGLEIVASRLDSTDIFSMQRLMHFNIDSSSYGKYLRMEVINSKLGPSSFAALYFTSNSLLHAVTLDVRLVVVFAEKIRHGEIDPMINLNLGPAHRIPIHSKTISAGSPRKCNVTFAAIDVNTISMWSSVSQNYSVYGFQAALVINAISNLSFLALHEPDTLFNFSENATLRLKDPFGNLITEQLSSTHIFGQHNIAVMSHKDTSHEMLWKACLRLGLFTSDRLPMVSFYVLDTESETDPASTTINISFENNVGRLVVMETVIAAGMSNLLAQYILSRVRSAEAHHSNSFLLTDVKRMHLWAVGELRDNVKLPSLKILLERQSYDLMKKFLAPYLLSKECPLTVNLPYELLEILSAHDYECLFLNRQLSREFPISYNMELESHISICNGLITVLEALSARKALDNSTIPAKPKYIILNDVIEEAQINLLIRLHEVKCLRQILKVVSYICCVPKFSLFPLLSSSVKNLPLFAMIHLNRSNFNPRMNYLPSTLHGNLLFKELQNDLHENVKIMLDLNQSNLTSNEFVVNILFLPQIVLRQLLSDLCTGKLHNEELCLTSDQILQNIALVSKSSKSLLLYFLIDAYYLSSNSIETAQEGFIFDLKSIESFAKNCGTALEMAESNICTVLTLWQLDAVVHIKKAVEFICSYNNLALNELLPAIVKRLLSLGLLDECRQILRCYMDAIILKNDKYMVIAYAAAIPKRDSWKEHDQVSAFLREMAQLDIDNKVANSYSVDLYFGYLLKNNLYLEALKIHLEHQMIASNSNEKNGDGVLSVDNRRRLLDCFNGIPFIPSKYS
eukprot:gene12726-17067_t